MGYTHYWTIKGFIKSVEWSNFITDFQKCLPKFQQLLEDKGSQKLLVTSDIVFFNGIGEEGHETFSLGLKDEGFSFCKTAQKPYDIAVTTALIIAKKYFGDSIEIYGDGGVEGFQEAKNLCQSRLGYGDKIEVDN